VLDHGQQKLLSSVKHQDLTWYVFPLSSFS
jgi:hypothetical protein